MKDSNFLMPFIMILWAFTLISGLGFIFQPGAKDARAEGEPTSTPEMRSIIRVEIDAPSLADNLVGEKTQRPLFIYLPPSYYTSDQRYPVIYYLPGFGDELMIGIALPRDFDDWMTSGVIRETIIVIASGRSKLVGSFYVNSPVTGNWEDFIVADVVNYVDANYRTLAAPESRGITGHSMGGFGALNIAMRHPEVFSAVYSMSPGLFDETGLADSQLFSSDSAITTFLNTARTLGELPADEAVARMTRSGDFALAYGAAFAPNPANPPPFIDYPYTEVNGERDEAIWDRWEAGYGGVKAEIEQYKDNLLSLNGIVVDYGTRDAYNWIPRGCEYFSAQLTEAGIPHQLVSFEGGHEERLGQRIEEYMLPFFSAVLVFE